MLMTHLLDAGEPGQGTWRMLRDHLLRFFGLDGDPEPRPRAMPTPNIATQEAPTEPILRLVTVEPDVIRSVAGLRWRRHPQLLNSTSTELPNEHREARHDAVRGLYAARAGALEVAVSHFARAAQCPDIDLSAIPGFWQLGRSAMMTAVDAYEQAGRIRDASALNARIRTMYRPRALTPVPTNVRHLPARSSKISSNS